MESQQAAQLATTSWPGLCCSLKARLRADKVRRGRSPPLAQPIEVALRFQSGISLSWTSSASHRVWIEIR